MKHQIPQFTCQEDKGHIIFVIPFNFVSEGGIFPNLCERYFKEIIAGEEKLIEKKEKGKIKSLYQGYKDKLCQALKKDALFAEAKPTMEALSWCPLCQKADHYEGRNLCNCLSTSRRFHDDRSQFLPRLEVMLGEYHIHYDDTDDNVHFYFQLAASLLLYGEKGSECGYLMYSIPLASIHENGFGAVTGNELDNIIFLKHLFYKKRLHCTINGGQPVSLQKWTEDYCNHLLPILGIRDYKRAFNDSINFRYSMIELNNIVDEEGFMVSLTNMRAMMQTYHRQLYGILVSDEGWKNTPDEEINSLFGHNYWTSRDYNCAIFLNRNAILINQYKSPECQYNRDYAGQWMKHYGDNGNDLAFYEKYISLEPCIPGVSTLAFDAFLRVICKELKIDIAKSRTEGDKESLEKRYLYLANTLQTYSMSLDVIRSLEDMICSQFGLQQTLNSLRDRYTREANNMQNKKVKILTVVTAFISLCSFCVSVLAMSMPAQKDTIFAEYQTGTYYIFFAAVIISAAILVTMVVQLLKLLLEK